MKMRYLRYLAAAGSLAATAGLLGACGSAHPPASGAPAAGGAATTPGPAPTVGLAPASRQLTDRLVLAHTSVTAGTSITGTLVVTNHGPAVNLTHGCRPDYEAVLTGHGFPPAAAFSSDCMTRPFVIKPGVNRLKVTVLTTYHGCTMDSKHATRQTPACLRGSRMPPLPEGRYLAVLVGSGNLRLPAPTPVPVLLTGP
jgi:hypothetical protein